METSSGLLPKWCGIDVKCRIFSSCVLAASFGAAQAQSLPPVQPQPGLHTLVTLEIRLKGAPTATNPSPTVKLYTWKLENADSRRFTLVVPCWNTKSTCPQVLAATVRVYVKLPWVANVNVTRFVLCDGSECGLPKFAPLVAKPGEGYRFSYNRIRAVWVEVPSVVALSP